MLFAANIAL